MLKPAQGATGGARRYTPRCTDMPIIDDGDGGEESGGSDGEGGGESGDSDGEGGNERGEGESGGQDGEGGPDTLNEPAFGDAASTGRAPRARRSTRFCCESGWPGLAMGRPWPGSFAILRGWSAAYAMIPAHAVGQRIGPRP